MDAAIVSESKYEDDGCIGHDEEVKCEDALAKLRSPAKFSTVRSVGQTFGGGMFMNLLEDAMGERERLHDAAMARDMRRRLEAEEKQREEALRKQLEDDEEAARRCFEEERSEYVAKQEAEKEKQAFARWQEEERARREEDADLCAQLQADEEARAKQLERQRSVQESHDAKVARKLQVEEAKEADRAVRAVQAAWTKPKVERSATDKGLRFDVRLPAVDRVTVMVDQDNNMVCLKAESHKFALHGDAASVAGKGTRKVLGKVRFGGAMAPARALTQAEQRNCFTLDIELTHSATVDEDGISYFYDNRREVLSLVLDHPSLLCEHAPAASRARLLTP